MKLYWATTEDHDEDWFIIASSAQKAATLHEEMEGYDPGDARAEEILTIPDNIPAEPGWPSNEILLAVGGKFINKDSPRIVEINGRKFCEGLLESYINEITDNALEMLGEQRLNKTERTDPKKFNA